MGMCTAGCVPCRNGSRNNVNAFVVNDRYIDVGYSKRRQRIKTARGLVECALAEGARIGASTPAAPTRPKPCLPSARAGGAQSIDGRGADNAGKGSWQSRCRYCADVQGQLLKLCPRDIVHYRYTSGLVSCGPGSGLPRQTARHR